ncbi:MAG TPA: hypothetical protein ENJ28_02930 [Gammaproteobacteria bacterium]|nr:hypothetical protein [Gammaproteobacteria bacterium]
MNEFKIGILILPTRFLGSGLDENIFELIGFTCISSSSHGFSIWNAFRSVEIEPEVTKYTGRCDMFDELEPDWLIAPGYKVIATENKGSTFAPWTYSVEKIQ